MNAINIHIIGDSVNQPFVIRIFNALISKLLHIMGVENRNTESIVQVKNNKMSKLKKD